MPASVIIAVFPAPELDLGEERLARLATRPVIAVIDLRIPFEVVVGFANPLSLRGIVAIGGVIPGTPEDRGHRLHSGRQVDLFRAPATAVMVGADGGLIHAGDHRRARGRADRCGEKGAIKPGALTNQAVEVRGLDRLFTITRQLHTHVIHHDPEDVGFGRRCIRGVQDGQGHEHQRGGDCEVFHVFPRVWFVIIGPGPASMRTGRADQGLSK